MSGKNLTLEDLKHDPLVQKFAALDPETAALVPEGEKFRALCQQICQGVQA
ncbi:hypothetical protein [Methanosarcina acetivorans]|uniref:hypothetical protein n=1 Tax=Methanosarcina acetivorans TaxID=2214 RepID=UPI000AAA11AB|nr:hypothetical protein [Methanosarcina acetivorans]